MPWAISGLCISCSGFALVIEDVISDTMVLCLVLRFNGFGLVIEDVIDKCMLWGLVC